MAGRLGLVSFSLTCFFCLIELAKLPISTLAILWKTFHFLGIAGAGCGKAPLRPLNACTRASINFNIVSLKRKNMYGLGPRRYFIRFYFPLIQDRIDHGPVLREMIETPNVSYNSTGTDSL